MSINTVLLSGNVGSEINVKTLPSGQKVANFSVATNSYYKDNFGNTQQNTDWHKIVCYGFMAERVENYLKAGSKVTIQGHLKNRSWQHQDGYTVYVTEVHIDSLDIHDPKPSQNNVNTSHPVVTNSKKTSKKEDFPTVAKGDLLNDELPF